MLFCLGSWLFCMLFDWLLFWNIVLLRKGLTSTCLGISWCFGGILIYSSCFLLYSYCLFNPSIFKEHDCDNDNDGFTDLFSTFYYGSIVNSTVKADIYSYFVTIVLYSLGTWYKEPTLPLFLIILYSRGLSYLFLLLVKLLIPLPIVFLFIPLLLILLFIPLLLKLDIPLEIILF